VASGGGGRVFSFAQFEFPWALGPFPGRYVLRDGSGKPPHAVIVISTLGASQRRFMRRRRPSAAEPEPDPTPVLTTRVTLIAAEPLADAAAAKAWLAAAGEEPAVHLDSALRDINAVIRAHRAAAADPYVREVGREQALVARLGHGDGEQVADGRWSEAIDVPFAPGREKRSAALHPQERLAAVLGGRDEILACEELILRARADLDAGNPREAALQLRVGLEAALAELDPQEAADMPDRLGELRATRAAVGAAANEAVTGPLSPDARETVERVVTRLEAALRARAVALDRAQ
jgi:hypothetical protein